MKPLHWWHSHSCSTTCTFNVISLCCSSSIHLMLYLLQWMWLVVEIGHLMCFNRWIHCFIVLKDDIHCDLFFEWIQWMIWFQMGTLCDLSLSWIDLMVLRFVVEKLEWHPKLNVLWVLMEIKAPLRRISFKYQLGRLREHEQRSSRMCSTDSSKSYGLKQIRGGPLSMIHVGNKELSPWFKF
jgi:hypothetical protein